MNYKDICDARAEAEKDIRLADMAVQQVAMLIVNRLRSSGVSGHELAALKRELKGFNMQNWAWKD